MNQNAKCEVKQNGKWRLISVIAAMELDKDEPKRCPTCYGQVLLCKQQLVYALEIARHCEYAWVELDMNSEQLQF